jgi:Ca2+-binding EF-hand superfamily protein
MNRLVGPLLLSLASAASAADAPAPKPLPREAMASPNAEQDVIFLGDGRPVFIRLRMSLDGAPFRDAWMESVTILHKYLDRDGDGRVSKEEADKRILATLTRVANGGATAMPRAELDNHPKDGVVSVNELADGLQSSMGPFRVADGNLVVGRTDALFERLDADSDGKLTKVELEAASASLRRLDLDDDERIDPLELEPFSNPLAMGMNAVPDRRARLSAVPPVLEMERGEPTLRPVRLLLKRYDKGAGDPSAAGDNKLSRAEFAVAAPVFAKADADADGALDTEELRRFLTEITPELELTLTLGDGATNGSAITVSGPSGSALPADTKVKPLKGGDVEIAIKEIRLEIHLENAENSVGAAKQAFMNQFETADTDNNGYLEMDELTKDQNHQSPLAGLFDLLDRDADGKVYPQELAMFVETQAEAAKSRMVLSTADQGRSIFAILDLNRDRQLGIREIRDTLRRVVSWDRDGNHATTDDEIPHNFQLTIGRAGLDGIGSNPRVNATAGLMGAGAEADDNPGPPWFRRMDRNRDGDISRREFLGPRSQFDRMDRDHDDLISSDEADVPKESAVKIETPVADE